MTLTLLFFFACAPAPVSTGEVHFVRGGVVKDGVFEAKAWRPGETVHQTVAPLLPECVPLFHVELEDMDRLAAMGAPAPVAALAFSPDGAWLAIGSDAGSIRVVNGATGAVRAERKLAEGAVKQVAWSPDGGTLYVGEQSPDANLYALDSATLTTRWAARFADELETSALPPGDDVYGLYSLPAVFALRLLAGGDLLVTASHGWTPADGVRRNRGRIYRYAPDGTRRGAFPAAGPADAILLHPAVNGDRALVSVSRSADGPDPADLPVGGVIALDLTTLTPLWEARFPVLAPLFTDVFLWEAAGISPTLAFAGLGDGRAFLFDGAGAPLHTLTPGVPVLSQGVPIASGVGFGTVVDDTAYFLTTSTNIPWGSADPMARPPAAHPAQHTLHAVGADGVTKWSWSGEHAVQGVVPSPDGGTLLVAAAERSTDSRTDLYGALLFDRATGALVTSCATEGPAYFRPVWGPDGRVAVAESAYGADGQVKGAYRVTVFR
ncbi:MAG: hypothetical protein V4850_04400 [Myxococcota bacterium]